MIQELLRSALDDADKWYELYLGQKFANERLVKEVNDLKAQLLKSEQHYLIAAEMLEQESNLRNLVNG
jgi:hypothetical protein